MKKVDYIIVGFGIAGLCTAAQLRSRGCSVVVIDSRKQSATSISGGTIHPVLLRYYNKVWLGEEFWAYAKGFYTTLENQLETSFIEIKELMRPFDSNQERILWQNRRTEAFWAHYLNPLDDSSTKFSGIRTPHGYGTSDEVWRFSPPKLLMAFKKMLQEEQNWIDAEIIAQTIDQLRDEIRTLKIDAKHIVLAQGHNQLIWPKSCRKDNLIALEVGYSPIVAKEGEYMIIESTELKLDVVLKGKFFIIPLGRDKYQVGATYKQDVNVAGEDLGRKKMKEALDELLTVPYKPLSYWTGTRPVTKDRKPILGLMSNEASLYTINGLNSRGLLMAPLLSDWLVAFMIDGKALPEEVSINRFTVSSVDHS